MSMLMSARGSSLRKRATSFQRGAYTTTVSSPWSDWVSRTSAGNCLERSSRRAFAISHRGTRVARASKLHEAEVRILDRVEARLDDGGSAIPALDLVLKEQETVEHRLWAGRAAGDVHVAGDDLVEPGDGRVVVVEAAARGAGAEREHPL